MLIGLVRAALRFARKSAVVTSALVIVGPGVALSQPSTVILVRHAEKALTPPSDPPLSPAGEQRARDLAKALADAKVGSIVTTQFERTKATAKPLADSLHETAIIVASSGDPKVHAAAVAAKVRAAPKGSTVLVVGHSNTIPSIIAALGGPKMPDLCDAEYSNLFVLEIAESGKANLIRGKFGAADAPDADGCWRTPR